MLSLIRGGAVDRVVISTRAIPASRLASLEAVCVEHAVLLSRLTFEFEHIVAAS
jgi:hypothetical protein